jgi:hypothetical protein
MRVANALRFAGLSGVSYSGSVSSLKVTGASFMIPPFPETDLVLDYHLGGAQTTLDLFGIADPKVFDAEFQKAG